MLKHKFNAKKAEDSQGIKYSSKLERKHAERLILLQKAGEVLFFLRQVPFHLPANVKYLADFMVFWKNGDCTIEECKGLDLPMGKLKRKQVEELYPVQIRLIHE